MLPHREGWRGAIGGGSRYPARVSESARPLPPDPVIEAYKRHVDRTLIRRNLERSIEERLEALMELQRFAEELHRAGREVR